MTAETTPAVTAPDPRQVAYEQVRAAIREAWAVLYARQVARDALRVGD